MHLASSSVPGVITAALEKSAKQKRKDVFDGFDLLRKEFKVACSTEANILKSSLEKLSRARRTEAWFAANPSRYHKKAQQLHDVSWQVSVLDLTEVAE